MTDSGADKSGAEDILEDILEGVLAVQSGCSSVGKPFVRIQFQGQEATISPESAGLVASDLLRAAAAAEADAMLLRFFGGKDFPQGAWEAMIVEWREFQRNAGAHEVKGP